MDINTGAKHEKDLQGVRMTPAKWTSIQEQSTIHAILLQDLMKRGVCRCAVEMLLVFAN
jgi:hypothetical protein